jgi:hypothetical protein
LRSSLRWCLKCKIQSSYVACTVSFLQVQQPGFFGSRMHPQDADENVLIRLMTLRGATFQNPIKI